MEALVTPLLEDLSVAVGMLGLLLAFSFAAAG